MQAPLKWFGSISRVCAIIAGWALMAISVAMCVEILGRKYFNFSFRGLDEIGGYMLAGVCAFGFAYTLSTRAHMRVTLLFPYALFNLGFLRILRLWTISRSGTIWRPLERRGYGKWRDDVQAVMNLLTFLLLAASFVYVSFYRGGNGLEGYVDALYVTVATVTTTGFGDMVLPGVWGKLTSIVIMIVGITLFVRLARSIFRPFKVYFPCPECALQRHDVDAVYCKACGHKLKIPDEGE